MLNSVLDEAYERVRHTGPERDGWLSNHVPVTGSTSSTVSWPATRGATCLPGSPLSSTPPWSGTAHTGTPVR
ncbi:hypothetical protein [Micromonospora aurantiaca (nom. illeg.)]|uniref:hypothetical protein n=1 Tax=Micromonospora aurantiaca (nom. illeg.) TaxID=47850 RepID=UPI0035AF28BB